MAAMPAVLDFRSERCELFLIYKSSQCFLLSFEYFGSGEEVKIEFQDGHLHFGFPIGMILAIFDL